jgi:protein-tyrosine phosphatase
MKNRVYLAAIAIGLLMHTNPAFTEELEYSRIIHLKGTSNTRDIGGYATSDGSTLRWRQIIRSDNLSRLTASDFQKLEEMGLKTIIDLRTDRENEQGPTKWKGDNPPRIYHFPIGRADNDWFNAQRKMLKSNRFTERQSMEHMLNGYRMIAEEGLPSYQKLMSLVLDESNWPVMIHCNAGKDRAGVATMLILEALGVGRETIMEDFLLTNDVSRTKEKATILSKERKNYGNRPGSSMGKGRGPSPNAWFPIVGVAPEMLEAFYSEADEQYGSIDALLNEIGVDQEARRALAASLTTEPELLVGE